MSLKKVLIYSLIFSVLSSGTANAFPGQWKKIGKSGAWKNTTNGTVIDGKIYSVEKTGEIFRSNPSNRKSEQITKSDFADTKFIFSNGKLLYIIKNDGTLYLISPNNGEWQKIGKGGEWKGTIAETVLNNKLYTVEDSGALFITDLTSGKWQQIGKPEFANTRFMFGVSGGLYTIETDGSLYKVNPDDGSWSHVGKRGDWKATVVGTVIGNKIFTIETSGNLYETDPNYGTWKRLGKTDFTNERLLFSANGKLYSVNNNGDFYEIQIK